MRNTGAQSTINSFKLKTERAVVNRLLFDNKDEANRTSDRATERVFVA